MQYRDLKKTLNESCVNPKKATGTVKVILDVNDKKYWITRAKELLAETEVPGTNVDANLKLAITLLALARVKYNEASVKDKKKA